MLVARGERVDTDVPQQALDLPVTEPRTFDSSRGADALNGSDATQAGQTLRRDPADCSLRPFELIDFRDQQQYFGR